MTENSVESLVTRLRMEAPELPPINSTIPIPHALGDAGGAPKIDWLRLVGVIGDAAEVADFWLVVCHCTSQCS